MLVLAAAVKYCVPEKRQRDRRKIPRVCSKLQGLQGLLLGGSVAEWLACWTQGGEGPVATLSGNSLRQTVHTRRDSVHRPAKLVAALLRVAGGNYRAGGK